MSRRLEAKNAIPHKIERTLAKASQAKPLGQHFSSLEKAWQALPSREGHLPGSAAGKACQAMFRLEKGLQGSPWQALTSLGKA